MTEGALGALQDRLMAAAEGAAFRYGLRREGRVLSTGDGVARASGPSDARLYELLEFEGGSTGIVFDLGREEIGVVLLEGVEDVRSGDRVFKTGRIASVEAGDWLLGRVVNPLGHPLDGLPGAGGASTAYPIEREAPTLIQREFVNRPLYTGIKVIDSMIPIGRGQRELIIGDHSTGKTSIGLDAIISQRDSGVICIYVAIGQKKSRVLNTKETVRSHGEIGRCIFVVADASGALGLQYIAPYSATAMAEYFLDRGRDVLIVYDDLTKHAEAYRSLSLLLRRATGREAYPGDIFFIHSRLLERSACLGASYGGGSITALPVVETQEGRISSFIPTNLISITDGQIYLDAQLFNMGVRPAVDVGKSVSRIGGHAQVQAMRAFAHRLKIDYSRFLDIEVFTRLGAHMEEESRKVLGRGQRLRELLKQPRFHPLSMEDEVLSFLVLDSGALDAVETERVPGAVARILEAVRREFPKTVEAIREEGMLSEGNIGKLKEFVMGL